MKYFIIGIILLIGLGYGGAKFFLYYKVTEGMDSATAAVAPYMELSYDGVSSTMTGELTISITNSLSVCRKRVDRDITCMS